jgi:predicted aspartyl protease
MTRVVGGLRDLVPVSINGAQKNFIFDTGGFFTQIARPTAIDLQLPMRQGNISMVDATGNISRDQASVHEFLIGHMKGTDRVFPVSPNNLPVDGIFAIDFLYQMDFDVDFGTDTLNFFSQDHCPGQVVYWTSPASASVIPITMDGYHILVPVTLDGQEERALIDTGAAGTALTINEAQRLFNLTLGSADTPEKGTLNGDAALKTYVHNFKSLTFGGVSVTNPSITLIPNAVGRNGDRTPLVSSRAQSEKTRMNQSDMIIGMDVLRKLHIYVAFKEKKMYVSPASTPAPATAPAPDTAK